MSKVREANLAQSRYDPLPHLPTLALGCQPHPALVKFFQASAASPCDLGPTATFPVAGSVCPPCHVGPHSGLPLVTQALIIALSSELEDPSQTAWV